MGWFSWTIHFPSTTNLNLIFSPQGILVVPSNPAGVFVRWIEHDHYGELERRRTGQFKSGTHIVKGSSDDNGIGLRMRPE